MTRLLILYLKYFLIIYYLMLSFPMLAFSVQAPLSATLANTFPTTGAIGVPVNVNYVFFNNLTPITLNITPISNTSGMFETVSTTCTKKLSVGESCMWNGVFTPLTQGIDSPTILANYNGNIVPFKQKINIYNGGYFQFRNSVSENITNLDLSPSASGNITLHNIAGSTINDYKLEIPSVISSYFSGSCLTQTSIAGGLSCILNYNIPAETFNSTYTLQATGTNVANSPHELLVNLSSAGHFVFRDSDGNDITTFGMIRNDSGDITIHNTGGTSINNISLTFADFLPSYFTSGSCLSIDSLAPGASCTLNYLILDDRERTPPDVKYIIRISGDNANNSPHDLSVYWV